MSNKRKKEKKKRVERRESKMPSEHVYSNFGIGNLASPTIVVLDL